MAETLHLLSRAMTKHLPYPSIKIPIVTQLMSLSTYHATGRVQMGHTGPNHCPQKYLQCSKDVLSQLLVCPIAYTYS